MGSHTMARGRQQHDIDLELEKINAIIEAVKLVHQGIGPQEISDRLGMKLKKARFIASRPEFIRNIVLMRRAILNRQNGNWSDERMMSELARIRFYGFVVRRSADDPGRPDGADVLGRALDDGLLSWTEYETLATDRAIARPQMGHARRERM